MGWVAPEFATYAQEDRSLAEAMTRHLYSDPSNPDAKNPGRWPHSGRVNFVSRRLLFESVYASTSSSQSYQLLAGRQYVLMSRTAVVVPLAYGPLVLPNEDASFINYREKIDYGREVINEVPLTSVFGLRPGFPFVLPQPEMGYGAMARTYTVTNNSRDDASIWLGWELAVLDTGR